MKDATNKKSAKKQCKTCQNFDKDCSNCKIKTPEEFSKINFSNEKCDSYLVHEKLVMF